MPEDWDILHTFCSVMVWSKQVFNARCWTLCRNDILEVTSHNSLLRHCGSEFEITSRTKSGDAKQ